MRNHSSTEVTNTTPMLPSNPDAYIIDNTPPVLLSERSRNEKNTIATGQNYSREANQNYLKENEDKIATKQKLYKEKHSDLADRFKHTLPHAGSGTDLSPVITKQPGILNTDTTNYGLETKQGVPWKAIREHIGNFDLIGFHGGEGISNLIARMQVKMAGHNTSCNEITHVGVAIRGTLFPENHPLYDDEKVYIWESTMSGPLAFDKVLNIDGTKCQIWRPCDCWNKCCGCFKLPPLPQRFGFLGSQFRHMDLLSINYDSHPDAKLIWMKLNNESRKKVDEKLATFKNGKPFFMHLFDKWNGTSYNSTCCCVDLWAAIIPGCRTLQKLYQKCCPVKVGRNGAQFCSEFAATLYKELGLLEFDADANRVVPSDYLVEKVMKKDGKADILRATLNGKFDNGDNVEDFGIEYADQVEYKSLDVDKAVPIMFESFWRFTQRSEIPNVRFDKNWVTSMNLENRKKLVDEATGKLTKRFIIDQTDVTETATRKRTIFVKRKNSFVKHDHFSEIPIAGQSFSSSSTSFANPMASYLSQIPISAPADY